MMIITNIFLGVLVGIFLFLGGLHFYWLGGGKWGFQQALPTKSSGDLAMKPRMIDTLIVAVGLTAISIFYFLHLDFINFSLPNWLVKYGGWAVPFVFIIRTIGEFKYVGLFKKIKGTVFAKADDKYFTPLCLAIGIMGIIVRISLG